MKNKEEHTEIAAMAQFDVVSFLSRIFEGPMDLLVGRILLPIYGPLAVGPGFGGRVQEPVPDQIQHERIIGSEAVVRPLDGDLRLLQLPVVSCFDLLVVLGRLLNRLLSPELIRGINQFVLHVCRSQLCVQGIGLVELRVVLSVVMLFLASLFVCRPMNLQFQRKSDASEMQYLALAHSRTVLVISFFRFKLFLLNAYKEQCLRSCDLTWPNPKYCKMICTF